MNEKEFAEMLGISTEDHYRMKHGGKARILKGIQSELVRIKEKPKIDPQGACVEMLNKCNKLGLTSRQAIKNTEEMLGISPEEMLEIMQDYQAEQKEIKAVANEGATIGG